MGSLIGLEVDKVKALKPKNYAKFLKNNFEDIGDSCYLVGDESCIELSPEGVLTVTTYTDVDTFTEDTFTDMLTALTFVVAIPNPP
jgi:hypothetical protein